MALVSSSTSASPETQAKWRRVRWAGRRNFVMGWVAFAVLFVAALFIPTPTSLTDLVAERGYPSRRWRAALLVGALTGRHREHQLPFRLTWECRVQGRGASVHGHCVLDDRALYWFPGAAHGEARELVVDLEDVRRAEVIRRWFGRSVLVLTTSDGGELWLAIERELRQPGSRS